MRERPDLTHPLREGWAREAGRWIAWVRRPGHDSYDVWHRDEFLKLLPAPGRQTLDLGSGEGRLTRHLRSLGHNVVGVDRQPAMVRAALEAGTRPVLVADAAQLPFTGATFDLVVAFMSLQDMDDMPGAVAEVARVLEPGGRLCLAVVHPMNGVGQFASKAADAPFVIPGDYFDRRTYADRVERDGLQLTFHQHHWTVGDWFETLLGTGLSIERVRETTSPAEPRWRRIPLFLHIRARRPQN